MSTESQNPTPSRHTLRYQEEAEKARVAAKLAKVSTERDAYLRLAAHWQRLAERYDWFEGL
jgi:hypothetical protein